MLAGQYIEQRINPFGLNAVIICQKNIHFIKSQQYNCDLQRLEQFVDSINIFSNIFSLIIKSARNIPSFFPIFHTFLIINRLMKSDGL